jgi:hypothetical protein
MKVCNHCREIAGNLAPYRLTWWPFEIDGVREPIHRETRDLCRPCYLHLKDEYLETRLRIRRIHPTFRAIVAACGFAAAVHVVLRMMGM